MAHETVHWDCSLGVQIWFCTIVQLRHSLSSKHLLAGNRLSRSSGKTRCRHKGSGITLCAVWQSSNSCTQVSCDMGEQPFADPRGALAGLYFISERGQLCKLIGIAHGKGRSPWQALDTIKVCATNECFDVYRNQYAKRCRLATKDEIELHLKHAKLSKSKG